MWYVIRLKLDIENTVFVIKISKFFFNWSFPISSNLSDPPCCIYWHGCCVAVACAVYPECESWSRVIFTASPRWPPTLPWNSADQNIADQFTSPSAAINMCRMNFTQTFNILYDQRCYLSPNMELIFHIAITIWIYLRTHKQVKVIFTPKSLLESGPIRGLTDWDVLKVVAAVWGAYWL